MSCAISSLYTVNEKFFYVLINWFYLPSVIFNANAKICTCTVTVILGPAAAVLMYTHTHTYKTYSQCHLSVCSFYKFVTLFKCRQSSQLQSPPLLSTNYKMKNLPYLYRSRDTHLYGAHKSRFYLHCRAYFNGPSKLLQAADCNSCFISLYPKEPMNYLCEKYIK